MAFSMPAIASLVALLALIAPLVVAQADVVSVAGGLDDITSRAATFSPTSITVGGADLIFTDSPTNRIRWIPGYTTGSNIVRTLAGSAAGDVPGKVDILLTSPSLLVRDDVSSNGLRTRYWFKEALPNGSQLKILDIDYAQVPFVTPVTTSTIVNIVGLTPNGNNGVFVAYADGQIHSISQTVPASLHSNLPAVASIAFGTSGFFALNSAGGLFQFTAGTWVSLGSFPGSILSSDGTNVYRLTPAGPGSYSRFNLPAPALVATYTSLSNVVSFYLTATQAIFGVDSVDGLAYGSIRVAAVAGGASTVLIGGVPPRSTSGPVPAKQARFSTVGSLLVDPANGNVLVGSYGALDLFNVITNAVSNIFGNYQVPTTPLDGLLGSATARFITGLGAHPDHKTYYFVDTNAARTQSSIRILRLNNAGDYSSGTITTLFNNTFGYVPDLVFHAPSLSLVFPDSTNRVILRYFVQTSTLSVIAGNATAPAADRDGSGPLARFVNPTGVAVSPLTGQIYVIDAGANKIKRIDPDTTDVFTFAGDGSTGQTNGVSTRASFTTPTSIEVSKTGVVYVNSNPRIRGASEATGDVVTVAGSIPGSVDDLLLRARLDAPTIMAVDNLRGGNAMFFIDAGSVQLRRVVMVDVCATASCNDGNHCTTDTCVSALQGCQFTPNSNSCDDGKECTLNDVCSGGVCTSGSAAPVGTTCFNGNLCFANQQCAANTTCVGTPLVCNDENLCTVDSCDPARGCVFTQISCDDSNPCTRDRCISNIGCVNEPIQAPCDLDNNPCTLDVCNAAGVCSFNANNTCSDNNPCTVDLCDPTVGCRNIEPEPCIGQNFARTASCGCACNITRANAGCPVPADSLQCLCLVPNTGSFIRIEVLYNTTVGERSRLPTIEEQDVFARNQMAAITLTPEIQLTLIQSSNSSVGTRRLVIDVYGGNGLSPFDILGRLASASDCNFLPPACVPSPISRFGAINILLINSLVEAAPVIPAPVIPPPPPGPAESLRSVVEAVTGSVQQERPSIPIISNISSASAIVASAAMMIAVTILAM